MSAIERRACFPIWDIKAEKIFTYLWYLNISDASTLSIFTSKLEKKCTNKKSQYPQLSKYEDAQLLSNITNHTEVFKSTEAVYEFAKKLFKKSSKKKFDELAKILTDKGVKSPDQVYDDWSEKYKISPDELPSEAVVTFLSEIHFSTKNVYCSWITVEKRLYSEYKFDSVPYKLASIYKENKGRMVVEDVKEYLQLKNRKEAALGLLDLNKDAT